MRAAAYWRLRAGDESRGLWLLCNPATGCVVEDQAEALRLLRWARGRPIHGNAEPLTDAARQCCARYARSAAARLRAARIAGDALRPGLPQCRIAAWLTRYFESTVDRLTAERREIIDDLLEGLGHRLPLAAERDLARLAKELPDRATWSAIERLAADLSPIVSDRNGPVAVEEVALLLIDASRRE